MFDYKKKARRISLKFAISILSALLLGRREHPHELKQMIHINMQSEGFMTEKKIRTLNFRGD